MSEEFKEAYLEEIKTQLNVMETMTTITKETIRQDPIEIDVLVWNDE